MTDVPLTRYRYFDSRDVDDTRQHVASVFCDHTMSLIGREAALDTHMNCTRIHDTSLAYIAYGGDVRVEPGECESFFPVMNILEGSGIFYGGRERIDGSPDLIPVASPTRHLKMRLGADTKLLIARIERSALEARLAALLDQSLNWPLEFTLGMDITGGLGAAWNSMFRGFVNEIDRHGASWVQSLAARATEGWLMEGLLLAQPSNYSRLLGGDELPVPNRAVNAAVDVMEAHPDWEHSIGSLAKHAGVSARALQDGFRRFKNATPLEYLRTVRLERAHQELRAATPGATTVGSVAMRWGFAHHSRFAALHWEKYGEYPSETLRR